MRFGVPQFNSLTTFFTGFYDSPAAQLARTGRSFDPFFTLGTAAGFIVSLISWKLLAVHLLGVAMRFALEKPASKFYYLKPTMPLYWNAVNTIVNQIAVNKGIVPRIGDDNQNAVTDNTYKLTDTDFSNLASKLPEIFSGNGTIDVYAMANRGQRLARKRVELMEKYLEDQDPSNDIFTAVRNIMNTPLEDTKDHSFHSYLGKWFQSQPSKANPSPKENNSTPTNANSPATSTASTVKSDTGVDSEKFDKDKSKWSMFPEFLKAELDDGSAFASFRVNATGPVSESFSNSFMESELANKINGMSGQSRSTRFDFADGNLGSGPLATVFEGVKKAVTSLVAGIGNGLEISGIAALGGSAFIDIPKHWQSSSASLPRANYTISLVSPYGNPISQMMNIYIPLAMLLAAALPLSTGKQSYTSPFLLELFDKGRCQTRLGMIDSLSITRGVGNMGFSSDGNVMAIDVTFSVMDMSSVLHMPIVEHFKFFKDTAIAAGEAVAGTAGAVAVAGMTGAFDDDTVFTDYMNTLSSLSLADQIYVFKKLKLQLTKRIQNFRTWTSPAHMASFVGDIFPARMISALYRGTVK